MIKVGLGIAILGNGDLSDKLLMVKRGSSIDGPGLWGLPGGHIEDGEPWAVAAAREINEEVGIICTQFKQLGWADYISNSGQQYITLFARALKWSGAPHNREQDKHEMMEWRPFTDIIMRPELYFEPLMGLIINTGISSDGI